MENVMIVAVVLAILGLAIRFIYREKKRGVKCVGCPHSKTCGSCNCGCGAEQSE